MDPKMTRDEEERTSGLTVAVFSIVITVMAVLMCVLVSLLTMQAKNPAPSGGASTSGALNGTEAPTDEVPSGSSSPVFAPSAAAIKLYTSGQTKTVGTEIDSTYAIIADAETGEILAGKNADIKFNPASMTKVMTLLVACERLRESDLTQEIPFTEAIRDYVRPNSGGYLGSSCHWQDVGDGATVLELLYGIGVESAADCSMMVVTYIVGKTPAESEAQFVQWMNEKAAEMGLVNTHFDNVIGYESENNYSTASDMAAILIRAIECPIIAEILATETRTSQAFGYNSAGAFVRYNSYYYSTLFNANAARSSRIKAYEAQYGTFKLANGASFKGGKTGSLEGSGSTWIYSLASFAATASGKTYVVVTGETTVGSAVMKDAKALYDTYMK